MMLRYLPNVVTLKLDREKCIGCRMCATVCPHGVFVVENGKARVVDRNACMECGACARNCPVVALRVRTGVGCATGVIYEAFGATNRCCCSNSADSGGEEKS